MRVLKQALIILISALLFGYLFVRASDRVRILMGVLLVLSPALIILGYFGSLYLTALIGLRYETYLLRRRMKQAGRLANMTRGQEIKDARNGTILVEIMYTGWNVFAIWWTPDITSDLSPPKPTEAEWGDLERMARHPFVLWYQERYLDRDTGTAILLKTVHGCRAMKGIDAEFGEMHVLRIWTGPWRDFAKPSRKQMT